MHFQSLAFAHLRSIVKESSMHFESLAFAHLRSIVKESSMHFESLAFTRMDPKFATYRVSQHHVSELLGGVGCTPMSRNDIAMQGWRCFFDAVDGVARKFRALIQGIVISHKDAELVGR
ncbi:hypothetical protein AVEN_173042-1 [Araneus ventricosus]|uniref:Uncharacterized protein n=1 Tax=Araneus ventricosus TaxID=182803 RepID=A0A4Y2K363_ARAVE|nr:hypothetical protein AVEN_173042-1 [Araneus ventricosus]